MDDLNRLRKLAGILTEGVMAVPGVGTRNLNELSQPDAPIRDRQDYQLRRKELQRIQMDPDTARDPVLRKELLRKKNFLDQQAQEMGFISEDESEMQTAATNGVDQADTAFDAAQQPALEAREPMYHSVFVQLDDGTWGHHFDADDAEDARLEKESQKNQGYKVVVLRVPQSQAQWHKIDVDEFVKSKLAAKNPAPLAELSKDTLNNYVKRASDEYGHSAFAARNTEDDEEKKEFTGRMEKRGAGLRAALSDKRSGMSESVPAIDSCNQSNPANADLACAMESGGAPTPDTEQILYFLTKTWNYLRTVDWLEADQKQSLETVYSVLRDPLLKEDFAAFEQAWERISGSMVDTFDFFVNELFETAGLDERTGTYEEFMDKCSQVSEDTINELSNKTLGSYYRKATDAMPGHAAGSNPGKLPQRMAGAQQAAKKMSNEAYDMNNGYYDQHSVDGTDYFPDGADGPVVDATGASGARQGDNPEQKKMAVKETHRELVYNYRQFLKESAKK